MWVKVDIYISKLFFWNIDPWKYRIWMWVEMDIYISKLFLFFWNIDPWKYRTGVLDKSILFLPIVSLFSLSFTNILWSNDTWSKIDFQNRFSFSFPLPKYSIQMCLHELEYEKIYIYLRVLHSLILPPRNSLIYHFSRIFHALALKNVLSSLSSSFLSSSFSSFLKYFLLYLLKTKWNKQQNLNLENYLFHSMETFVLALKNFLLLSLLFLSLSSLYLLSSSFSFVLK